MHNQASADYWTMVAALGQVAGAVATFAAVAVSLWFGLWERRPRLSLRVDVSTIVGVGWDEDFISFRVANRGSRPVRIVGYGFRTGWWFQKQSNMVVNHDRFRNPQHELPALLNPGDAATFTNDLAVFLTEVERLGTTFTTTLPFGFKITRRVRGHVYTADGFSKTAPVSKSIRSLILDGNRDDLPGAKLRKLRSERGSQP